MTKRRRRAVKQPTPLTDRERILTTLVSALATTSLLRPQAFGQWSSEPFKDQYGDYVHFAPWRKPVAGDLVRAKTGGTSRWSLSFYVEPLGDGLGGALVREIGSERTCRYSNEEFEPVVGLSPTQLLEGDRYQVYLKVIKAFNKLHHFIHRFGGVSFPQDQPGTVTVWVREYHGGILRLGGSRQSQPYSIAFPWTPTMTIKAIRQALLDGGFGTKTFIDPPAPEVAAVVAPSTL